jgi:hypothetical protein
MATFKPRDLSSIPREADRIPLPSEEITPPVTKIYFTFFGRAMTSFVVVELVKKRFGYSCNLWAPSQNGSFADLLQLHIATVFSSLTSTFHG